MKQQATSLRARAIRTPTRHRALLNGSPAKCQVSGVRCQVQRDGDHVSRITHHALRFHHLTLLTLLTFLTAPAATVTGNLTDISLSPLSTKLVFTPASDVLITQLPSPGSPPALSAGPPKIIDAVNGAFSIVLDAGDYTVSLPLVPSRQPFLISVPDSAETFNIVNLLVASHTALNALTALSSSGRDDLNRWSWINTLKRLQNGQPAQVMALGNSMISASGPYLPVLSTLQTIYGQAGGSGRGWGSSFNMDPTAPATTVDDGAIWFKTFCRLAAGGMVTWYSAANTSVTGNVVEVDYIAKNGAGSFKVQTNIANSGWADVPSYTAVNADNGADPAGIAIRVTNAVAAPFQLRVVGLSGVVDFPGGGILDLTHCGIIGNDFSQPGASWQRLMTVPDSVKGPILNSWAPELILCEFVSTADDFHQNLPLWAEFMKNWLTNSDFVVIASPPQDFNKAEAALWNYIARTNAAAHGWGYFDGNNIFGGFTNGFNLGLLQHNDPHPTTAGQNFIADALFNWLDLADTAHLGFWNAPVIMGLRTNFTAYGSLSVFPSLGGRVTLGSFDNTSPGIWFDAPAGGNDYALIGNSTATSLNAPSGGNLGFQIGRDTKMQLFSSGGVGIEFNGEFVDPGAWSFIARNDVISRHGQFKGSGAGVTNIAGPGVDLVFGAGLTAVTNSARVTITAPGANVTTICKASATSRNNTTTLADDPDFSTPLASGHTYLIELLVFFRTDGGANAGFSFSYNHSGSVSFDLLSWEYMTENGAPGKSWGPWSGGGLSLPKADSLSGGDGAVRFTESVHPTANTTLTLQWAQKTANANSTWISAGSYLMVRQLD